MTSDEDERQAAEERDGLEHSSVAQERDDEEEEESSEQEDDLNKGSDNEEKSEEEEERDEEDQEEENEQDEEDDDDNSAEEDDEQTNASNVLANYSEKLQKALVGDLDGGFPENVKVVRIFTSSTFTGKYIKYFKVTPTVSACNLRYCGCFPFTGY